MQRVFIIKKYSNNYRDVVDSLDVGQEFLILEPKSSFFSLYSFEKALERAGYTYEMTKKPSEGFFIIKLEPGTRTYSKCKVWEGILTARHNKPVKITVDDFAYTWALD